jgi:hypothetical protein
MAVTVQFHTESCVLKGWSAEDTPLLTKIFQLLPDEVLKKEKIFPKAQAESLTVFLRSKNFEVNEVVEDPAEYARYEVWRQKLRNPPSVVNQALLNDLIAEIGIDLRDLQRAAISRLLNTFFGLLAAGCGAGKTLVFLFLIEVLKRLNGGKVFAVVACPSACAGEYRRELAKYRGYFSLSIEEAIFSSSRKVKQRIQDSNADILIVSIDSVHNLTGPIRERLQAFSGERVLNIDEGHSIKAIESRRSRGIQQIAPFFDRVMISTATPVPKNAADLRGYIATVGFPQPAHAYSSGIPDQDYQLLRNIAFVTDETDIPFGELSAKNVDFEGLDDLNGAITSEVNAELAAGNKVIIFCSTNAALLTAHKLFPNVGRSVLSGSYGTIDCMDESLQGGRSVDLQKKAVDQFNFDPRCRLLIANYKVGSTGLNLQYSNARMAVFYEITSSGADLFQSKYRIRRPMIFPNGGFKYLYAIPKDPLARRRTMRQFAKLSDQSTLMQQLKAEASNGHS